MDGFDRERRREDEERELLQRIRPEDRFTKLLKSSQSLVTHIEADSLIPALNRGPEELKQASHRLSVASERNKMRPLDPKVQQSNRIKAQRMLARSGYDPEKLTKDLTRINLQRSFEPYQPLGDTDVEGYLKHHHDIVILTAIEEAKKSTILQSKENFDRVIDDDWSKARQTLTASFAQEWGKYAAPDWSGNTPMRRGNKPISQMGDRSMVLSPIAPRTPFNGGNGGGDTSFTTTPGLRRTRRGGDNNTRIMDGNRRGNSSILGKRAFESVDGYGYTAEMTSRMLQYAKVVWRLNNCVTGDKHKMPFGITTMFRYAEEKSPETNGTSILGRCWHLLAMIVGEETRYKVNRETGTFEETESTPDDEKLGVGCYKILREVAPGGIGGFGSGAAGTANSVVEQAQHFRRKFLWGSRHFLETQMRNKLVREMGRAGGRPALRDQVLGYLQKKVFRNGNGGVSDDGDFFWPMLFYMLRCGCSQRDIREFMRFATRVEMEIGRTDSDADQGRGYDNIYCLIDLFVSRNASFKASLSLELTPEQSIAIDSVRRLRARWAENRSTDWTTPYLEAVLNLISHFDSRAPLRIDGQTIEDAMWQKMCFILAPARALQDQSSVPYSLQDLSAWILRQDRDRFKPMVYFNALLLCLEFEEAIGFLASKGKSSIAPFKDVVHFAIVLNYYGVLRTPGPDSIHASAHKDVAYDHSSGGHIYCVEENVPVNMAGYINSDPNAAIDQRTGNNGPQKMSVLCFERLLRDYTRLFEQTEPDKACEYLLLLRSNKDAQNSLTDAALHFISEVVLISGCFDSLLGDEYPRLSEVEFRDVVDRAARRAQDKEGQYLQAISLYIRTDEYQHVVTILNRQLGRVVVAAPKSATATGQLASKAQLRKTVRKCAEEFVMAHVQNDPQVQDRIGWQEGRGSSSRAGHTLQQLLFTLMPFFDLCLENKWLAALRILQPLELLPLSENDLSRCVEKFQHADESIRRNIHHVMLAKMEALYSLHQQAKRGSHSASTPVSLDSSTSAPTQLSAIQTSMVQWRREARLLVVFANMLPSVHNYSLPDNVRAQLFRMQVDL